MEILELKTTISEIKNVLDGLSSRTIRTEKEKDFKTDPHRYVG